MHETRHDEMDTYGSPVRFSHNCLTMKLQRPRELEGVLWVLGAAIGPADLVKEHSRNNQLGAVGLIPAKGNEFLVCDIHRVLADIYRSKGERGDHSSQFTEFHPPSTGPILCLRLFVFSGPIFSTEAGPPTHKTTLSTSSDSTR